jgi:electron transfer flavoprotein alpha subunit
MSILVIAEHNNQELQAATTNALSAAKLLAQKTGSKISLLIAGYNCAGVANDASSIEDIETVLLADCLALENQLAENLAPYIAQLVKQRAFSYIMAPATTMAKNVLPRAAALLDVAQISDVIDIIDDHTFVRPIYAGSALETLKSCDEIKVMTIRASAFDAVKLTGGNAPIESLASATDTGLSRFISESVIESDRPELGNARIVISGGRGMQSGDNFTLLEVIADKLGAAIGASRAAVDAGYVSNDMQVGQTGKIIAPDLYIAVGISGAIQHLAGMKDSKIIVAINKDEDAPIFNVADFGLIADLFEALPELEVQLQAPA